MENISDKFAFFKSSVVVVIVCCNHLAEMVGVAFNDDFAFIFFIRQGETAQSCGDFREIQILGFISCDENDQFFILSARVKQTNKIISQVKIPPCIIMSARFVYWNIFVDALDIHQKLTVLSIGIKKPFDKNNVEEVCILCKEMTRTVFVFVIVSRNAHPLVALKRRQLDV